MIIEYRDEMVICASNDDKYKYYLRCSKACKTKF